MEIKTLTITIPATRSGFIHGAAMLSDLARAEGPVVGHTRSEEPSIQSLPKETPGVVVGEKTDLESWAKANATPPAPPSPDQAVHVVETPEQLEAIKERTEPVTDVEVDKTGRPWDERIDSSNRKKIADGTWQKRRNVPKETYEAVVAELMDNAGPEPVAASPVPTQTGGMPASPPMPDGTATATSAQPDLPAFQTPPPPPPPPPPAPTPAAAPPPPPPTPIASITFGELVQKITSAGLNFADVARVCQSHGLNDFTQLATRADLVPTVAAALFPNG